MKLYGLQGVKGLITRPAKPRKITERGLSPKKRDSGPPVGDYFAWYQALTSSDLLFDGDNVVGWRGLGYGAAEMAYAGAPATYGGPGLSFPSTTSKLRGGSFDDARTAFAVFGAGSWREYAGIISDSSGAGDEYVFLNAPSADLGKIQMGWSFSLMRMNGVQGAARMEYALDGTMNVVSAIRTAAGSLGGTIQIGNDRNNSSRNWPGRIGEVLLYQKILSDAERGAVERWLAARWGIQSKFV